MRNFLNVNLRTIVAALFLGVFAISLAGCSRAEQAKIGAWGQRRHIKQYSGGRLINEWHSTGQVEAETESDGYYFEDEATHKVVRVSGDIQVTIDD